MKKKTASSVIILELKLFKGNTSLCKEQSYSSICYFQSVSCFTNPTLLSQCDMQYWIIDFFFSFCEHSIRLVMETYQGEKPFWNYNGVEK